MNENTKQPINIKQSVLERLEAEGVSPRSRIFWVCQEYVIWSLWGITILFGAISVAVVTFASMHAGYALYEATHESFLTFAVEVLPYIWFGVFILMCLLAYYNMRHTKHGYKYPLNHIIISSIGFSILGGLVLHYAGVGYYLDTYLGRVSSMYQSQEEMEIRMWQMPEAGRLIGVYDSELTGTYVEFTDIDGREWNLDTVDLRARDLEVLNGARKVRVLGLVASGTPMVVHACGVFPWMMERATALGELRKAKQEFLERITAERNRKPLKPINQDSVMNSRGSGLCDGMEVFSKPIPVI